MQNPTLPPRPHLPRTVGVHAHPTLPPFFQNLSFIIQKYPSPLRILPLPAASDPGGLSRYLLDLSTGLLSRGHTVTIAGEHGPWHDRFTSANLPWLVLPLRGGPLTLRRAAAQLKDYLATHPTDIIHTHYRKPTLVAPRATKGLNIPP